MNSKGKNATKENYKDYFEDPELKAAILKEIDTYSRANDLKGFEIVKNIHLCKEPFTVDNNLLTTTLKIRRHIAKKYFLKEIEKMYGK